MLCACLPFQPACQADNIGTRCNFLEARHIRLRARSNREIERSRYHSVLRAFNVNCSAGVAQPSAAAGCRWCNPQSYNIAFFYVQKTHIQKALDTAVALITAAHLAALIACKLKSVTASVVTKDLHAR